MLKDSWVDQTRHGIRWARSAAPDRHLGPELAADVDILARGAVLAGVALVEVAHAGRREEQHPAGQAASAGAHPNPKPPPPLYPFTVDSPKGNNPPPHPPTDLFAAVMLLYSSLVNSLQAPPKSIRSVFFLCSSVACPPVVLVRQVVPAESGVPVLGHRKAAG